MTAKVFLRLEPLGLELVAEAARMAGHDVRLIDLQIFDYKYFQNMLMKWQPDVVAFSLNYLANTPEVIDLAKMSKQLVPSCYTVVGGHSASFIPRDILRHGGGSIDCVMRGEGEAGFPLLLKALGENPASISKVPGSVTMDGEGPMPCLLENLDIVRPARDLTKHRNKYFLGVLDPCASIEFTRGCPWDCSFCSAWTFYGRSYRLISPEVIVEELERIKEPGVFVLDDVAFVNEKHSMEIGEAIARKGIKKKYYVETRGDILIRNKEVFKFWKKLGLDIIFIGLEAIDEEGLQSFRKRTNLGNNFEALEVARSLDICVAVNIIADPDWDKERFEVLRQWCLEVPDIVNVSIMTPYPGTENWYNEPRNLITSDYRLFDIMHVVMPTKLPLAEFYQEFIKTQQVMNMKHLGWAAVKETAKIIVGHLLHGQTNFLRSIWKFNTVFNANLLLADHSRPVTYELTPPPMDRKPVNCNSELFVHCGKVNSRDLDSKTAEFIETTQT